MITLTFQTLVGVLSLVFGAVALQIGRKRYGLPEAHGVSWKVVGIAFVFGGIANCLYSVGAIWAFLSGPDSAAWAQYVRWSPTGNYARAFVKFVAGAALALAAIASIRSRLGDWKMLLLLSVGAYVLGGVLGWIEGTDRWSLHYTNLAIYEAVEVGALLSALLVGLLKNSMDRHLWIIVGLYTFRQVLNVLFWAAFAWITVDGAWTPHPSQVHIFGAIVYVAMIAVAARRLQLARRGVRVPSLAEPLMPSRASLLRL